MPIDGRGDRAIHATQRPVTGFARLRQLSRCLVHSTQRQDEALPDHPPQSSAPGQCVPIGTAPDPARRERNVVDEPVRPAVNARRGQRLLITSTVIVLIALLRVVGVVSHDPILGFANQYDMARVSACLDFWPRADDPTAATPSAPFRTYERRSIERPSCQPGSEVVIGGALLLAVDTVLPRPSYDLRIIGFSKFGFLVLAVLFVSWQLRVFPVAGLIHSAIVLAVLSDPLNSLYLNSLYAEFSALLGCYAALGALAVMLLKRRLEWVTVLVFIAGLLVLLTSKMQHLALPWFLLAVSGWYMRRFSKSMAMVGLVGALAVATAWQLNIARFAEPSIHQANIYNTAFFTLLPALPESALARLGLDDACRMLVGTSWFQRRGHVIESRCPLATAISRAHLLSVAAGHPLAVSGILARSVFQSSSWRVGYVGEVEGQVAGRLGPGDGLAHLSVSDLVARLEYPAHTALLLMPVVYAFMWLVIGWLRPSTVASVRGDALRPLLNAATIGAIVVWLVVLVGDGFSDLAKHMHLAINLLLFAWLLMLVDIARHLRLHGWASRAFTGVLFVFAILASAVITFVSTRPAAVGTLDSVPARVEPGDVLTLTGWIKDPFGPARIEVRIDGQVVPGTLTTNALDVDAMFPVSAAHPGRRFQAVVAIPDVPGVFRADVIAINTRGTATRVDSIWLESVPGTDSGT